MQGVQGRENARVAGSKRKREKTVSWLKRGNGGNDFKKKRTFDTASKSYIKKIKRLFKNVVKIQTLRFQTRFYIKCLFKQNLVNSK